MKKFIFMTGICLAFFFFGSKELLSETSISKSNQLKSLDGTTLLFIPLDDRPVNTDVANKLAETIGLDLLMPDKKLLGKFETTGDVEKISDWVLSQSNEADGFVISIDMLVYGGLVASRSLDISEKEAKNRLEILKTIKEKYPEKPIFVHSSLLRLAPTASDESSMDNYRTIREWAIAKGGNESKALHLENEIDSFYLEEYKSLRKRNYHVNQRLLSFLQEGVIDYLIFGQDDAFEKGLHRLEQLDLKKQIKDRIKPNISFFSGTDESSVVLLSRFVLKKMEVSPRVHIIYDSPLAKSWTAPMDDMKLEQNIIEHMKASGAVFSVDANTSDYQFYMKTKSSASSSFVNKINKAMDNDKYVSVADVATLNKGEPDFAYALLQLGHSDKLLSYSGWNTAGNTIGLSLAFANMRYAYLETVEEKPFETKLKQTLSHTELLYRSFLVDVGYKAKVYELAKEKAIASGDDILNLMNRKNAYESFIKEELKKEGDCIFSLGFENKKIPLSKDKNDFIVVHVVELLEVTLPWDRLFEIKVDPEISFSNALCDLIFPIENYSECVN